MPPHPSSWTAAAAFVVIALLCAASLARHGARSLVGAAEANHVVMAGAMAVMVAPGGAALVPPPLGTAVCAALGAAWLVVLLAMRRRDVPLGSPVGVPRCSAHPTHLLLVNAAMAVMYAAMLPASGSVAGGEHAGHGAGGGTGLGGVATVLALYLVVQAVATVAVLAAHTRTASRSAPDPAPDPAPERSVGVAVLARPAPSPVRALTGPTTALLCQAAMGLGMAAMMLAMLLGGH